MTASNYTTHRYIAHHLWGDIKGDGLAGQNLSIRGDASNVQLLILLVSFRWNCHGGRLFK